MVLVSSDDIAAAATRIAPYVLRTPLLHSERLSHELGCRVLGLAALRAGAVTVPDGSTVVLVASGGNAAPPRD